ncbi:MAG: hypothetical protein Q9M28_04600 [Mariprofundaceae bacterium]|nr:hypothetical protein [Mariprofundaceae bacterium]
MDEQDLPLEKWYKQLITMNMQQAVQALVYWVEELEKQGLSCDFRTQVLELIVQITRRCHVLSDDETT